MINRDTLIVRFKQPFVDWINEVDPTPQETTVSLEDANEDVTAFLVPDGVTDDLDSWLAMNYLPLFEFVLDEWYVDESLWPQDRTLALFKSWCHIDLHSMVVDTVDEEIVDDELD